MSRLQATVDQWLMLTDVCTMLKPLAQLTDIIQSDSATLRDVHNTFHRLCKTSQQWDVRGLLISPRMRSINWYNVIRPILEIRWEKQVNGEAVALVQRLSHQRTHDITNQPVVEAQVKKLLKIVMHKAIRGTGITLSSDECERELMVQYNNFTAGNWASLDTNNCTASDITEYYLDRLYDPKTSILAHTAFAILSIVPSEAAVERSFSAQKHIHTNLRNRLTNINVESQMVIRMVRHATSNTTNVNASTIGDDTDDETALAVLTAW